MFFIGAIKPSIGKKLKTCLFLTRLFRRGESGEYKIKPVLLLFVLGLLAATKTIFKRNEKKNTFQKVHIRPST